MSGHSPILWTSAAPGSDRAAVIVCDGNALPYAAFLAHLLRELEPEAGHDIVICLADAPQPAPSPGVRLAGLDCGRLFGRLPVSRSIPRVSYGRLLLPEAFPEYDRILYLDADMLPRRAGIGGLLDAAPPAAVSAAPDQAAYVAPDLPPRDGIWRNAGLLLIDAARARAERTMPRVLDHALANIDALTQHDQSALNLALRGELGLLSPVWNWMDTAGARPLIPELDPVLLHFVASPKPWDWLEGHPRMRFFDDYARFLSQRFGIVLEKRNGSASWTQLNAGHRVHRWALREAVALWRRRRRMRRKQAAALAPSGPPVPPGRLQALHAMADL